MMYLIKLPNRIKLLRVVFFMVLWVGYSIAWASLPMNSQKDYVTLQWQEPRSLPVNADEFIELIYFDGAVYGDSMPQLPLFQRQWIKDVPLFSYTFLIEDKEFIPVSPREDAILRSSGFLLDSIHYHTENQEVRKETHQVLRFFPFRFNKGQNSYEKLRSFSVSRNYAFEPGFQKREKELYKEASVLAAGNWYRICLEETGVYRLGYDELEALGMSLASVRKEHIRLFGNGGGMLPEANAAEVIDDLRENAIYVSGSGQGLFGPDDYVLFYGRSPDQWNWDAGGDVFRHHSHLYADQNCYFVTTDQGPGKRIQSQPSLNQPATHEATTFHDFSVHRRDLRNLIGSGRTWYGEVFDSSAPRSFEFSFPNLTSGEEAFVEVELVARSSVPSYFQLQAGDATKQLNVLPINPADYNGFYAREVNDILSFSPNGNEGFNISLAYSRPASGTLGWLNYIVVNAQRDLRFEGPQMAFRNTRNIGSSSVFEYLLSHDDQPLQVWDVSDRFNVKNQEVAQQGNVLRFTLQGNVIRELIAFDGSTFLSPRLEGPIQNQNLHGMKARDMFIVVPEEMLDEAQRLANFRQEVSGLSVGVVTTKQVYNEFSSGSPDASAIRNFMKMFYDRAGSPAEIPSYLLLFGSGTLDNRDFLEYGGNLIPTYQSAASLSYRSSYMTDDYFGLLADHEGGGAEGVLDIGIGRLPVRTPEEAKVMVDKIIRYEQRVPGMDPGGDNMQFTGVVSNYADWRNMVVFIADDGDINTHFNHAEILAGNLTENHPTYNTEKIYLDAYQQFTMAGGARYPGVNRAINERVNKGALMINYIGHGGTRGLAQQRVVTFDDIETWNNRYNMPVFMTATCDFSRFDQPDPEDLSAGVHIVLKPVGGTVALYTTTRLAWSGSNLILNRNFMEAAFALTDQGMRPRLGDLIRIAKQKSSGGSTPMQLRNFVLLGDPSMQMAYPSHQVVTTHMPDTIQAFQVTEVSGYVTDREGNKLDDYQGVLFPTVFDKKTPHRTLGNNPGSVPADFSMRNAILYKGKTRVEHGEFSFEFMVPKDIAYRYGEGKISYYLDDGHTDGHGAYSEFIVGGTLDTFEEDKDGPVIDLYINDTTFVSGDFTNENPILLAFLSDKSGINLTGRIGHDIVAFLNGNTSEPIRLNRYFEADLDTYRSGQVVYPFSRLEDGHHTLTLRAWDVHNNPSAASIEFVVGSASRLTIDGLMNYPNPFSEETHFVFKHNQAFSEMEVEIAFFDLQGKLVNQLRQGVSSPGFRSAPIRWDGVSNDGRPLASGMYIYRIRVKTPDGQQAVMADRLLIIRENP